MKGLAIVLFAAAATPSAVVAAVAETAIEQRTATSLSAVEDARFAALVRGDTVEVGKGLAEDLIYTHANGRVQDRDGYLRGIAAMGRPLSITASDRTVRIMGDVGVIHATRSVRLPDRTLVDTYLAVYRFKARHWILLAWQTSPASPA